MLYVYPDTNVFLHVKHFESIDWQKLLDTKDGFTIVIAAAVVAELDKHKYSNNAKRAQKAKNILPRLETLFDDPAKSHIQVKAQLSRTLQEIFDQNNLDKSQVDDILLASLLVDYQQLTEADEIILFTGDVGPRLKAKRLGIKTIKPLDEDLLDNEPDETQKELIKVRKELDALKLAKPKMELGFDNGFTVLTVAPEPGIKSEKEFLSEKENEWKKEFPPLEHIVSKADNNSMFAALQNSPLFHPSVEQVNKYNNDLQEFFKALKAYWTSVYQNGVYRLNTIAIDLILKNTGTVPARDVDIHLHFPDGFNLLQEKQLPKTKGKPKPPFRPKNMLDHEPFLFPMSVIDNASNSPITSMFDPHAPQIKKTNSYDVDIAAGDIKHHQQFEVYTLFAHFENLQVATGFQIDYTISVGNLPQSVSGKLHVKITHS